MYEVPGQTRTMYARIPEPPDEITIYFCGNIARRTISGAYVCNKCNQFWGDLTNDCYAAFQVWKELQK
jgi:hypothetical protein